MSTDWDDDRNVDDRNVWDKFRAGTDGTQNAHWVVYGLPVYAMTGGTVVECQWNIAENRVPGEKLSGAPAGGNHLTIQNDDGDTAHYAHFQPNTVPTALCSIGARVNAGDRLGLVGNSGNSTNPHLHIHLIKGASGSGGTGIPLMFHGMSTSSMPTAAPASGPPSIDWSTRAGATTAAELLIRPDNSAF